MNQFFHSIALASIIFISTFLALLFFPGNVKAQTSGRQTSTHAPGPPRPPAPSRLPSIRERQLKMLEMEREAARPRVAAVDELALTQIAEDFERIQSVNNRLLSTAIPAPALDHSSIAKSLGDIKTSANRLKANLALGISGERETKKRRNANDADGVKANLLSLDRYINRFVSNEIFKNPDVVNVEEAKKARQDLETIIELAEFISKDVERLKTTNPE